MESLGLQGVRPGNKAFTTVGDPATEQQFTADAPNWLWVPDTTYVPTWSGFTYAAFARRRVLLSDRGLERAPPVRTDDLPLEALDMTIWQVSRDLSGLEHHRGGGSRSTYRCAAPTG